MFRRSQISTKSIGRSSKVFDRNSPRCCSLVTISPSFIAGAPYPRQGFTGALPIGLVRMMWCRSADSYSHKTGFCPGPCPREEALGWPLHRQDRPLDGEVQWESSVWQAPVGRGHQGASFMPVCMHMDRINSLPIILHASFMPAINNKMCCSLFIRVAKHMPKLLPRLVYWLMMRHLCS